MQELDRQIQGRLDRFGSMLAKYSYGETLAAAHGGHHIEKALQQPRATLLTALLFNNPVPFGPLSNAKAIVQVASEDDESEIDITDLVSIGTSNATTTSVTPATNGQSITQSSQSAQQQQTTTVQNAWSTNNATAPGSSLSLTHPHSLKLFQGKVIQEEKGGPRIRDVLEQVVDLKSLRRIDSLRRLPQEHVYSGNLAVYLTLQGLDNHQKATQIARRLKTWLALYDSKQSISKFDTRPSMIHVYPNQQGVDKILGGGSSSQHRHHSGSSESDSRRDGATKNDSSGKVSSSHHHHNYRNHESGKRQAPQTICLVQFHDPDELEHVYRLFKSRGDDGPLNEAKQPIRFGLAYDSRCLGEMGWVGIVLRNLPGNATEAGILQNFSQIPSFKKELGADLTPDKKLYNIVDVSMPTKVKDQYCAVLTVGDIEEAERVCLMWNGMIVNDKQQRLKAHIHPYSFRRRPTDKISIHPLFRNRFDPATVKPTPAPVVQSGIKSLSSSTADHHLVSKNVPSTVPDVPAPKSDQITNNSASSERYPQQKSQQHKDQQRQQQLASPSKLDKDSTKVGTEAPIAAVAAAPKRTGLLALVDDDPPLAASSEVKKQKSNDSASALAIMNDIMFEDDVRDKKRRRKQQIAAERRLEQEQEKQQMTKSILKQVAAQKEAQYTSQVVAGKKRPRDATAASSVGGLQQSTIDRGGQLKRQKIAVTDKKDVDDDNEAVYQKQQLEKQQSKVLQPSDVLMSPDYSELQQQEQQCPVNEHMQQEDNEFQGDDDEQEEGQIIDKEQTRDDKEKLEALVRDMDGLEWDQPAQLNHQQSKDLKASEESNGTAKKSKNFARRKGKSAKFEIKRVDGCSKKNGVPASHKESGPFKTTRHGKRRTAIVDSDSAEGDQGKESVEFSSDEEMSGSSDDSDGGDSEKSPQMDNKADEDDNQNLSSPTEATENVVNNNPNAFLQRTTRSGTILSRPFQPQQSRNIVDFTTSAASSKTIGSAAKQNQDQQELRQLGRSSSSYSNSREITPVTMKQFFSLTNQDKAKVKTLEDSMKSQIENGHFFNPELLSLVAEHLNIAHPEVLLPDKIDQSGRNDEPRKRGRKTTKQRVQELARQQIKKPLSHIKCSVSFSVPQSYADALSASNASS